MGVDSAVIEEILKRAERRASDDHLAYRGAVKPDEAWTLLQGEPRARLLDIRSKEEWNLVGRIPGAIEIELKRFPAWVDNPDFLPKAKQALSPDDLVLLICRSGARSHKAAEQLTEDGYKNCFNVLEGFEGERNEKSQRLVNGWRVRGLPWSQ
jgi:rhodanese-related sulfurtransferase